MAAGKEESAGVDGQITNKALTEFDAPKKKRINKFAIACTVLASMTSILLGYGEFRGVICFGFGCSVFFFFTWKQTL